MCTHWCIYDVYVCVCAFWGALGFLSALLCSANKWGRCLWSDVFRKRGGGGCEHLLKITLITMGQCKNEKTLKNWSLGGS